MDSGRDGWVLAWWVVVKVAILGGWEGSSPGQHVATSSILQSRNKFQQVRLAGGILQRAEDAGAGWPG